MTFRKLVLGLHYIPMPFGTEESPCVWLPPAKGRWLKSPMEASGDWGWLNTSKSSSESKISTTFYSFSSSSSFHLAACYEGVLLPQPCTERLVLLSVRLMVPNLGWESPIRRCWSGANVGPSPLSHTSVLESWTKVECSPRLDVPPLVDHHCEWTPRLWVSCLDSAGWQDWNLE